MSRNRWKFLTYNSLIHLPKDCTTTKLKKILEESYSYLYFGKNKFIKDGAYYDRLNKTLYIQIRSICWIGNKDSFLGILEILNIKQLSLRKSEVEAIKKLKYTKVISSKQKHLLIMLDHVEELRKLNYTVKKSILRFKKETTKE